MPFWHSSSLAMPPLSFPALSFAVLLFVATALRFWLATRHGQHIRQHRAAVPASFQNKITLTAHQKAADYSLAKLALGNRQALADTTLLLWLTFGQGLWQLSDALATIATPGGLWHGLALLAAVALLGAVVDMPFSLVRTFRIEARFGFNRTSLPLFLADLGRGALLGLLLGGPLAALFLWLMTEGGPAWWLWGWLAWAAFNLLLLYAWPAWIAPRFNRFEPLQDHRLRPRIEALLTRCGTPDAAIYVIDGSRRSSHGNAWFSGIGGSRRVVFFDTLIERLSPDELEAVLAHEIGHYRCHHLWKRLAIGLLQAGLGLALLAWLHSTPEWIAALGANPAVPASTIALFLIAVPPLLLPLAPLFSGFSRRHEFEADAYAKEHSEEGALTRALVRLYDDNAATLTPDPLHSLFYDSHPPASTRIAALEGKA